MPARSLRIGKMIDVTVTAFEQALNERLAVDALDRRFARGVDVGDDDVVGIVEAGAEILEEIGEARIAMRLHHGDDLATGPLRRLARRLEHTAEISTG